GAGHSLERQDPHAYGNDPANWASSLDVGGTPGAANSGGLVSKSAGWRYHDRGEDLGTAWRAAGYDDGAWRDGNGPLGYANVGDYPDLDTVLDYGDDPNNKPITTYFRKRFILGGDPANVTNLTLEAKYDDGFAAYLNGQEVARAGLSGTIAYGTLADNHDATSYMPFNLLAHKDKLVAGENVLAVELHQAGSTSSDLFWDAELRYAASQILPVATPTIAPNGGEFTTSVSVTIACTTAGATIFYRTDQADPTDQSYHGYGASPRVLTLSGSATVKARAYKAGLSPSGIAEATFTEILPTVATPTIAPAGGDFYGSVSVTIACGTTGATIFYRTDGTDATDQSYHGSGLSPRVFTLSDSATVKARAYKAEHNPSAVASASFTDRTPTVCFAGSTSSGSESASPASLAVVLSGTSPQTITVAYAVGGGTASGGGVDYTLAAGTLTFAAGQTNQTISVPVMDDSLEEAAETVVVSLVYPVNAVLGAPAAHTYTILDNDRLWTAYNDLAWTNGQLAQNITRYTRAQSGSLVDYASGTTIGASLAVDAGGGGPYVEQGAPAAAGTDAHGVFAGIVDAHGLISYGSNLTLRVAGLDSSLRYELVLFGNRDNAGYTDRLTTVTVSDAASFENASTPGAAFSGPSDDSTVVCNGWNTQNGYVVRYARIDPGPDGDVLLTVSDNASLFYLNALMVRASRPQADLPAVSFEQAALDVGESAGTVGLAVHLDQAWTNEVRVDYQTAGGTATPGRDYTAASGTLTFAAGQTQKTITLAIGNDGESEDDETVTVSLANPVEATIGAGTCTVTIEDDDGPELLFTAYNDLMWASGQLSANITLYTAYTGGGLPGSGHLVDYASGTNVSVTLGVSTEDTYRTTGYPEQGADAVAGAEAFETFNGKVNCAGLMSNGKHTLAFGGMDPAHRYSLVLFGNRDNSGYTALTTDFVISGVASFQNTSSPGTQILGSGAGPTNDLTRYCTGWNRTNGYVARFADIRPAAAGTMTLTVQGSAFYVNALMLQGFRPSESAAPVVKVGMGAQWAYRKGTAEAGSFWRVPSFDDGDWERGAAPFGYGDGSFGTTLDDMRYTYSCVFLRRAFEISSPALVSELVLDAEYDDGFIVWLNGEEVARVNMTGQPGEPVAFDNETAPLDSIEPTAWRKTCSAAGLPALLPGTNLLAVQVFNYLRNSSDLLFDLALSVVEGSAFAPSVDADRDGMPDDWEADQLGGTGQPGDADPDGDGLSSLEEYIAGTDPDELASIFGVSVRMDAGHALVRIPTVAAGGVGYAGLTRLYALEARSGMAGGEPWQLVPGYEAVVGNGLTAVYTNTAPGAATCYRARVWLED
ncbi:MAG: chitobiase/beta-hexosaminidase C-terminal domain-containing protein, partial [Kiritimatiellae bacterium]|nr:chitobiase/beta-hexosaminidase C-terminal domain-containing protein [Kiritimatiellia bacterium]